MKTNKQTEKKKEPKTVLQFLEEEEYEEGKVTFNQFIREEFDKKNNRKSYDANIDDTLDDTLYKDGIPIKVNYDIGPTQENGEPKELVIANEDLIQHQNSESDSEDPDSPTAKVLTDEELKQWREEKESKTNFKTPSKMVPKSKPK
jgi:hypothetical protein